MQTEKPEIFLQDILASMRPKPIDHYRRLIPAAGVQLEAELSQDEAALALRVHDHGIDGLNPEELQLLYQVVGKLKDQIWP